MSFRSSSVWVIHAVVSQVLERVLASFDRHVRARVTRLVPVSEVLIESALVRGELIVELVLQRTRFARACTRRAFAWRRCEAA